MGLSFIWICATLVGIAVIVGRLMTSYNQQDTKIKLGPLAEYAGVTFKQQSVVDITLGPDAKSVTLDDGQVVNFDVASFDIGSTTRGIQEVPGVKTHAIPTRPISSLVDRIQQAEQTLGKDHTGMLKVVVIGAGAAGIELAFAMQARWNKFFAGASLDVTLCDSGIELLAQESEECRAATTESLGARGVTVLHGCHVASVQKDMVVLEDGRNVAYTHCIWATGAASHPLAATLGAKGIKTNPHGWIEVNEQLQSVSVHRRQGYHLHR